MFMSDLKGAGIWIRYTNECSNDLIYAITPQTCLFVLKFLPLQNALVVPHAYNWTFTIRPNDIREDRLSRDITENVHSLVARRYGSFEEFTEVYRIRLI